MASVDENANEAKQTPAQPPSPPAEQGDDRISGLCDDVLVRILGLAGIYSRELVRTGVLSRRWHGLWTRVPRLHFMSPWPEELVSSAGDVIGQYVPFVNSVLAQRARSEASLDSLLISLFLVVECLEGQRHKFEPPGVEAVEAWIWYAVQHHVRHFELEFRLPIEARQNHHDSDLKRRVEEALKRLKDSSDDDPEADEQQDGEEEAPDNENDEEEAEAHEDQSDGDQEEDDDEDKPVIDLDELPSSTKLETMYLGLSRSRVRLPSTAVFASLKNLMLQSVELAPGSGHLLSRLSSSACCPSLQQLHMKQVLFKRAGTKDLVLDAGELLELSMDGMKGMTSLELRTPNLLCLEITNCDEIMSLAVSAPALAQLTFQGNRNGAIAIHGDFPCVWRLKTDWVTHLSNDDDVFNDARICLVKRCSSSATSMLFYLHVPLEVERHVDLIKDKIPQLPNVTSLQVNLHPIVERHSFGDGVAGLLTRFNNLEYLSLQLDDFGVRYTKMDEYYSEDDDEDSVFICNHADKWESNSSDISLAYLREACFRGMTGTGCELRFLQMVLAGATSLKKVFVSFNDNYNLQDSRIQYFLHTLLEDGTWTVCQGDYDQSYQWKPVHEL